MIFPGLKLSKPTILIRAQEGEAVMHQSVDRPGHKLIFLRAAEIENHILARVRGRRKVSARREKKRKTTTSG